MPPLTPKALVLAGLLVAAGLATPFLLRLDGGLQGIDVESVVPDRRPAPPTLRLLGPEDGQGVADEVRIHGEAASAEGGILDVQWRVDGGPWSSLPDVVAGQPLAPFDARVPLAEGDHVVEVRAFDGESFSMAARALVRAAPGLPPPTVRIAQPLDGQGLAAGEIVVRGTVEPPAPLVLLRVAGVERRALVLPGGAWSATVPVPPGSHDLSAHAPEGLPDVVRLAVGPAGAPPTLRVTSPSNGSAYGGLGDPSCPAACIRFAGVAPGARDVLVSIDGSEPLPIGQVGGPSSLEADGAWTFALPRARLLSGEHRVELTPVGPDGLRGAPQAVALLVRASLGVRIAGDDAPRPTLTPLRFAAEGDGLAEARWLVDGVEVARGPSAQVVLATPGLHALVVNARDSQGRTASAALPLYAMNRPPEATLVVPAAPVQGTAELEARGSDPDGRVAQWRWESGDGFSLETPEPRLRHEYARPGVYRVNVTPVDERGARGLPASGLVTVVNALPTAAFSWTPGSPRLGEIVTFTDASADPEDALVSRAWDFGDGATATGSVVTHAFSSRGPQRVLLTVRDAEGGAATAAREVVVANLPPLVAFSHEPQVLQTGREVLFLDRSVKTDGRLVAWSWDFGHECPAPCEPLHQPRANGSRVLHAFPAPGEYDVNLTVTDDLGVPASLVVRVVVQDAVPEVSAVEIEPREPRGGEVVAFRARARDPETKLLAFSWDFGDGATSDAAEPTHRYARPGVYRAGVRVTDSAGQVGNLSLLVVVRNAEPNATLVVPASVLAGRIAVLEARAVDADGDVVRVRFDADGDGIPDCDGARPRCAFTYARPGSYVATVAVVDDQGGDALAEAQVEVTLPEEDVPRPVVRIETPSPGATAQGRILLSGEASGARPIERVEVQLRNASWALSVGREAWMRATGNGPWRLFLDTRVLPDGEYALVVRAVDAGGAEGLAESNLSVANGPKPSLLSLTLVDAPTEPLRRDHEVRGSAWHPDGPVTLRYRLDEGPWRDVPGDPVGWSLTLSPKELGAGLHTLRVDARRGLSEHTEETLRFRVADPPPALVVDEAPTPIAYGLLAAKGRLVGEGRVLWRLDHDVWRSLPPGPEWRLSLETARIEGGMHVLWLRTQTVDGLAEGEPVRYDVRIVNPPVDTQEERDLLRDSQRRPGEVDLEEVAREQDRTPLPAVLVPLALLAAALLARSRRSRL